MSDGFVKLYGEKLLSSSIWDQPAHVRIAFIGMLASADMTGFVRAATVQSLARTLNLTLEETREALAVLEAPDEASRDEDSDGRRVLRSKGGWFVVNYGSFREKRVEAPPPKTPKQVLIYFARSGRAIKIGCSRNPWARLNELRTGAPEPIELLGTIPGTHEQERELHSRFEHLRQNREWFRAEQELLDFVVAATATATELRSSATTATCQLQQEDRRQKTDLPELKNAGVSEPGDSAPKATPPHPGPPAQPPANTQTEAAVRLGADHAADVRVAVRDAFVERFRQATGDYPAWSDANVRALVVIADWLCGNRKGGELAAFARISDTFFADARAAQGRFPIAYIASDPGKYLNPPKPPPRAGTRQGRLEIAPGTTGEDFKNVPPDDVQFAAFNAKR